MPFQTSVTGSRGRTCELKLLLLQLSMLLKGLGQTCRASNLVPNWHPRGSASTLAVLLIIGRLCQPLPALEPAPIADPYYIPQKLCKHTVLLQAQACQQPTTPAL